MHINQETLSQREPWNAGRIVGANPADYGTHSLRRTKVSILY